MYSAPAPFLHNNKNKYNKAFKSIEVTNVINDREERRKNNPITLIIKIIGLYAKNEQRDQSNTRFLP